MSYSNKKKNTLKVVVIGDSGVGKTSLMHRYISGKFSSQYRATVGADFLSNNITHHGKNYSLQVSNHSKIRFGTLLVKKDSNQSDLHFIEVQTVV